MYNGAGVQICTIRQEYKSVQWYSSTNLYNRTGVQICTMGQEYKSVQMGQQYKSVQWDSCTIWQE